MKIKYTCESCKKTLYRDSEDRDPLSYITLSISGNRILDGQGICPSCAMKATKMIADHLNLRK